ncbi:MAG: hypothetical protein Kapaf2KO_19600 [Candidatus Kapaibacteriales bacterium]
MGGIKWVSELEFDKIKFFTPPPNLPITNMFKRIIDIKEEKCERRWVKVGEVAYICIVVI